MKDRLQEVKDRLQEEKDRLQEEQDRLQEEPEEQDRLQEEQDSLQEEQDRLQEEQDRMHEEQDRLQEVQGIGCKTTRIEYPARNQLSSFSHEMGGSRRERKGSVEGKDNMLEHSITPSHQIKGGGV